jgi:hypothetical protein
MFACCFVESASTFQHESRRHSCLNVSICVFYAAQLQRGDAARLGLMVTLEDKYYLAFLALGRSDLSQENYFYDKSMLNVLGVKAAIRKHEKFLLECFKFSKFHKLKDMEVALAKAFAFNTLGCEECTVKQQAYGIRLMFHYIVRCSANMKDGTRTGDVFSRLITAFRAATDHHAKSSIMSQNRTANDSPADSAQAPPSTPLPVTSRQHIFALFGFSPAGAASPPSAHTGCAAASSFAADAMLQLAIDEGSIDINTAGENGSAHNLNASSSSRGPHDDHSNSPFKIYHDFSTTRLMKLYDSGRLEAATMITDTGFSFLKAKFQDGSLHETEFPVFDSPEPRVLKRPAASMPSHACSEDDDDESRIDEDEDGGKHNNDEAHHGNDSDEERDYQATRLFIFVGGLFACLFVCLLVRGPGSMTSATLHMNKMLSALWKKIAITSLTSLSFGSHTRKPVTFACTAPESARSHRSAHLSPRCASRGAQAMSASCKSSRPRSRRWTIQRKKR